MGSFLQFRGYWHQRCRDDKRLNQPYKRGPIAEMAGFAGEDMGEGAAEFGTAVARLLNPYPHSEQMRGCLWFAYSCHPATASVANDRPSILKDNGRIVSQSFPG
jgi:hypothetical protein